MSDATKNKIRHIVADYEKFLATDYANYLMYMKTKEPLNQYAEFKNFNMFERHLLEIPETLYNILYKTLIEGEWEEFASKEGQRWFARVFKKFAVPERV